MAQKTGMSPSGGWRVLEVEDGGQEMDKQVKIRVELPQPPSSLSEGGAADWGSDARDEPRLDDASWVRSSKGVWQSIAAQHLAREHVDEPRTCLRAHKMK